MTICMTKSELLAQLKANLKAAEAIDAKAIAKHKIDEETYLQKFRKSLAVAAKWDYATAKKHSFRAGVGDGYRSGPSCPKLEAVAIRRVIRQVELDNRDKYQFLPDSDIGQSLLWKSPAERRRDEACHDDD